VLVCVYYRTAVGFQWGTASDS